MVSDATGKAGCATEAIRRVFEHNYGNVISAGQGSVRACTWRSSGFPGFVIRNRSRHCCHSHYGGDSASNKPWLRCGARLRVRVDAPP